MPEDDSIMADDEQIDDFLAAVLRGEDAAWPAGWRGPQVAEAVRLRAIYHGIAGFIIPHLAELSSWPPLVVEDLRQEALGQAMWELRHRTVLAGTGLVSARPGRERR